MRDGAPPEARVQFERLFGTCAPSVRRHLVYLTGDRALAEDLTQETFGKLYALQASSETAPELRNPEAWLLTVASNLAYNHFRSESRRATREAATGAPAHAHAAPAPNTDDVIDVRRALGELESRDRMALMLRHSGFSYAEIAEVIGVAPGSVGTTLARAQARFRTAYLGAENRASEKE